MSTTEMIPDAPFFPPSYPEVTQDSADALSASSDILAVLLPEGAFNKDKDDTEAPATLGGELSDLDSSSFNGLIAALTAAHGFSGAEGSVAVGPWIGGKSKLLALVGLGKAFNSGADADAKTTNPALKSKALREAGKQIAVSAKSTKSKAVSIHLPGGIEGKYLEGLSNGILLGGYEATRFKAKAKLSVLETVKVHTSDAAASEALNRGTSFAKGTLLARYLVEAPANICTPTHLAKAAEAIKDAASDVFTLDVLERDQCAEMGMGCYLGVAECSSEPPKFIHLTYKSPGEGERKKLALVGKGLTFDSGGYNIKVGGMIDMMKFDMGGCGAVLGAAHTIGQIKPANLEVHFISASCENMIDGKGMRPGDVLTSAKGKTIEINNTDAEGRLTLADALWYAQEKVKAPLIIDIATLTGAQMVAVGTDMSAVLTPNDPVFDGLLAASNTSGEKIWRLPLHDPYLSMMKSHIADLKNAGARFAGTITAGLFLKEFIEKETEWAHIDIAGPAWSWEGAGGATGYGAALLAEFAIQQNQVSSS